MKPRSVRAIAALLLLGTTGLCLVTSDVGFTRDESFYLRYAESYQSWFTGVAEAETPDEVAEALGRDRTVKVWRGNFEHPPLMKTLFGFSWRVFGRKDRKVSRVQVKPTGAELHVVGLGPADGFEIGSEALLLSPLARGVSPTSAERVLAKGRITKRGARTAVLWVPGDPGVAWAATCRKRAGDRVPDLLLTGCQAREKRGLAVLSESNAMRLPGYLSTGLVVMLTFLLGRLLFSWPVGLFAALAFLCVPRHFFHGHLACFDMPIVAATLFVFYAFWRALSDRRWALIAGLAWGVALLVKHNAFFLPFPLVLIWLWFGRDELRLTRRGWRIGVQLPKIPLALLVMPVVALTMLIVFWPRLWYDPFVAISEYFGFHLQHVHYLQWYFGEPLQVAPFPFDVPFGLTLYTVPEPLILLFGVGAAFLLAPRQLRATWRAISERKPSTHEEKRTVFTLLNGLFPLLLIALPSVPIFGGVKHWMTGMPFLLMVAGYGFIRLVALAFTHQRPPLLRRLTTAALAGLVLLSGAADALHTLPFGTGYYNSLFAGGSQGAADRQMMRVYWGQTSGEALDWVNENAPQGARIYFQNTPRRATALYQREGRLRADLRPVSSPHGATIALVEPQKSFAEREDRDTRRVFGVAGPLLTVKYDGVNMLRIYRRAPRVKPPPRTHRAPRLSPKKRKKRPALRRPSRQGVGSSPAPASPGWGPRRQLRSPSAKPPARRPGKRASPRPESRPPRPRPPRPKSR